MANSDLRDIFGEYLVEAGKKNKDLVVLDSDLSISTRTSLFAKKFPERFFNVGIAEQNLIGIASGLAISGKTSVVSGFSIFTTGRGWEFIRLACHDNLNLKIIPTHGGFVGEDGSSHHALQDLSIMSILPNLSVLVPLDKIELTQILEFVINTKGPFYIRLPRGSFPEIHNESYNFSFGKPDVLKSGEDICLIGTGYGSTLALNSAQYIEKELKISLKIINLSTIKPIDKVQLIKEIKEVKGIVIIEEHNIYCGIGSIISRIISENHPKIMKFVGIENSFGRSGKRSDLLNAYGLNEKNIFKNVSEILKYLQE